MTQHRLHLIPLLVLSVVLALAAPSSAVLKYKTSGTYADSAGGQHEWSINDAHTLIWGGEAYIPVGGAFVSRYVSAATDENFQADVRLLEQIKSKGITDLVIKSSGPITACEPASWQKLIDHLESQGFAYGIEMNDGPKDALKGYVVAPNLYRLEGPSAETTITCSLPDVDSAVYVVVKRTDNSIVTQGGAVVKDGKATVSLQEPLGSAEILIVYPHKAFRSVSDGGIGDIWTGFGEYRDRVLAFFKGVKFGPGLRFFLEPFTSKMDFTGEMVGFVPDSSGFRLGLEAHLTRKYVHEGSVNAAWGMNENLDKIEVAARLVPLWSHTGRGIAYAYDKASAHLYSIDATVTRAWNDIIDYRDTSAQTLMNTMADTLKKQVANVPVVYKNATYHRIYANPFGIGGMDGIGAEAVGVGDAPVKSVGGPAYSLAEESGKTTWFLMTSARATADGGYPGENALVSVADLFREVGAKGFYVDGLQRIAESAPQQLDWLKSFRDRVDRKAWTDFKPEAIYYPSTAGTGAYVTRLQPNTWWLPTLRTGKSQFIGDGLGAYSIVGEDRAYLWSRTHSGANTPGRTVTLKAGPTGAPSVAFPPGVSVKPGKKDQKFTVALTNAPTVLRGLDISTAFPYETTEAEIARLAAVIPEADKKGVDVKNARTGLERAQEVLKNGQPLIAFGIAQSALQEVLAAIGIDLWLEGEQSTANNFSGPASFSGASDGQALLLDTAQDAPLMPYTANFRASAATNASYEIWVAGTPQAEGSPMKYSVDDAEWTTIQSDANPEAYAPGLAWYKIGSANLIPGTHTIRLRADGRRASDNRYYFAIDAVVLSPGGFKPNGVNKPY